MRETATFPVWNDANFTYATERGDLRIWLTAPTTLVMLYHGYAEAQCMQFVEDVWLRTLDTATASVQIFADTEQQTGFAAGFRSGMAKWNRRIVARTDTYCLLVKSRWVAMGIAVVRATVGGSARHVEVTTSRELFHSRLDTTVRKISRQGELVSEASS